MRLHKNIRAADPRTRAAHTYSAPANIAAEDEVADFIAALIRLIKPRRVLELGTAWGHTSKRIGEALQENGFGELDTMDINEDRLRDARVRCRGLPINIHHSAYQDFAPSSGTVYDLCFFDSDRGTRDIEYATFKPYLSDTAILLFHDAGEQHDMAVEALDRLDLDLVYLPCPRGLMIASER